MAPSSGTSSSGLTLNRRHSKHEDERSSRDRSPWTTRTSASTKTCHSPDETSPGQHRRTSALQGPWAPESCTGDPRSLHATSRSIGPGGDRGDGTGGHGVPVSVAGPPGRHIPMNASGNGYGPGRSLLRVSALRPMTSACHARIEGVTLPSSLEVLDPPPPAICWRTRRPRRCAPTARASADQPPRRDESTRLASPTRSPGSTP